MEKNLSHLTPNEQIDVIKRALEKANLKGVYTLDEAYVIKYCLDRLSQLLIIIEQKKPNKQNLNLDQNQT